MSALSEAAAAAEKGQPPKDVFAAEAELDAYAAAHPYSYLAAILKEAVEAIAAGKPFDVAAAKVALLGAATFTPEESKSLLDHEADKRVAEGQPAEGTLYAGHPSRVGPAVNVPAV